MTLSTFISFFIMVLIMVLTPGPMTLYMMANGMQMQYQRIWPILIGANNAYLFSIILFTFGLNSLLQKNIVILNIIKIIGIVYLFYLAYIQWNKKTLQETDITEFKFTNKTHLYKKGALIAFSNPKAIILFSLIFPQFIGNGNHYLLQISILGITFLILQFSSGCIYAYFGKLIKNLIKTPPYQRLINKISSMVYAVIAVFLILKF